MSESRVDRWIARHPLLAIGVLIAASAVGAVIETLIMRLF